MQRMRRPFFCAGVAVTVICNILNVVRMYQTSVMIPVSNKSVVPRNSSSETSATLFDGSPKSGNEVSDRIKTPMVSIERKSETEDMATAVTSSACNKIPDVLIIGFEKCGTVALKGYLNIHPDIFAPMEPNDQFFNLETTGTHEQYKSNWKCTPKGMIKLEKMGIQGVPKRVYKLNPNVKLLVIVKEPVKRTVSHFTHRVAIGSEKNGTFERVVTSLLNESPSKGPEKNILFSQGMYNVKLQPWLNYFNKSSFHVVDGDAFVKNPAAELSKVEQFLGVKPFITSEHFVYNKNKGFYCIRNDQQAKCMDSRKGRPHPIVDPAIVKRLRDFFRQHNEDFFDLFGKQYSWNDN